MRNIKYIHLWEEGYSLFLGHVLTSLPPSLFLPLSSPPFIVCPNATLFKARSKYRLFHVALLNVPATCAFCLFRILQRLLPSLHHHSSLAPSSMLRCLQ